MVPTATAPAGASAGAALPSAATDTSIAQGVINPADSSTWGTSADLSAPGGTNLSQMASAATGAPTSGLTTPGTPNQYQAALSPGGTTDAVGQAQLAQTGPGGASMAPQQSQSWADQLSHWASAGADKITAQGA